MRSPKINAKKILESTKEKLYSESNSFESDMFNETAKKSALLQCDTAIEALSDYNKSLVKLKEESEAEALVLEKFIKFWVDTKEEIHKANI